MITELSIQVPKPAELIGLGYTHIEMWVSEDQGHSYRRTTLFGGEAPAWLDFEDAKTLYRVGGRSLRLVVDNQAEVEIDFSTVVEYWTPAQVAARINEVLPGLASAIGDAVRLTATLLGRKSRIRVTYCDALEFGLTAGQEVRGHDAAPVLDANTHLYIYRDDAGSREYRYRFYLVGPVLRSEPTELSGKTVPLIASENLSIGQATFVTADGRPKKTRVIVGVVGRPQTQFGMVVGTDIPLVFESDEYGSLAMPLVRGLKVRAAIEGTPFIREFTVPNAPTFDLLQVMADAPDTFTVQTPAPLLTRRS